MHETIIQRATNPKADWENGDTTTYCYKTWPVNNITNDKQEKKIVISQTIYYIIPMCIAICPATARRIGERLQGP